MALVLKDRVQESATPNTTVSFTCNGAITGFQAFSVIGNGNVTFYTAVDASGNWENGVGTYTTAGNLVTRTTISASSNAGSAVTFSGTVNLFISYPATKSINLDASGNASPLGTVASGTWQGSTVGVAYGGTGVTASSGANSVVLRDADQNAAINRINQSNAVTTSAAGTTILTAASSYSQTLVGTAVQTYKLPDATTLATGVAFEFNNNSTSLLTIQDDASATIATISAGGSAALVVLTNATVAGTWDTHGYIPENVTWGTNALVLGGTVITGGTWQGGTIAYNYGGTGLTTFAAANNALYSTSATALTAGTLPVLAGGTGVTTSTGTGSTVLSTSPTLVTPILGTPASGTLTSCTGLPLTTGVTGTLAVANGGTGVTTSTGTGSTVLSASPTFTGTTTAANLAYTGTLTGGTGVVAIGTSQIYKDASGNVGIGVISSGVGLNVFKPKAVFGDGGGATGPRCGFYTSATAAGIGIDDSVTSNGSDFLTGQDYFGINRTVSTGLTEIANSSSLSSSGITFGTGSAGTERMRIDSSGNLLVGTSVTGFGKVAVGFNGATYNALELIDNNPTTGTGYLICRNSAGTEIGSIKRVGATNAIVFNTTSDERLKSNIVDANPVLKNLMSVRVRQYDWTDGDLHQDYGFIAQELEPVLSGIVTKGKTEEDMWQLDYSRITPCLVKAIQELKAIIDTQNARIEALEAN